jgi:hypothetical protein
MEPSMADQLSEAELAAVAALVKAVVERNFDQLSLMVRPEHQPDDLEELYVWTKGWRDYDEMTLLMPPGHPRDWQIYTDNAEPDGSYRFVVVDMWTKEEGPSDLSLEMDVVRAWFRLLHVR